MNLAKLIKLTEVMTSVCNDCADHGK